MSENISMNLIDFLSSEINNNLEGLSGKLISNCELDFVSFSIMFDDIDIWFYPHQFLSRQRGYYIEVQYGIYDLIQTDFAIVRYSHNNEDSFRLFFNYLTNPNELPNPYLTITFSFFEETWSYQVVRNCQSDNVLPDSRDLLNTFIPVSLDNVSYSVIEESY